MKTMLSVVTLCITMLVVGCVNGKLDPRVAPAVQAAGAGCALIPTSATIGPVSDEEICDALITLVSGALKLVSTTSPHDAGDAGAELTREGVARNGVVIYVGPSTKAAHLRHLLDTDAEFASEVDALLAARK